MQHPPFTVFMQHRISSINDQCMCPGIRCSIPPPPPPLLFNPGRNRPTCMVLYKISQKDYKLFTSPSDYADKVMGKIREFNGTLDQVCTVFKY